MPGFPVLYQIVELVRSLIALFRQTRPYVILTQYCMFLRVPAWTWSALSGIAHLRAASHPRVDQDAVVAGTGIVFKAWWYLSLRSYEYQWDIWLGMTSSIAVWPGTDPWCPECSKFMSFALHTSLKPHRIFRRKLKSASKRLTFRNAWDLFNEHIYCFLPPANGYSLLGRQG
jgi:hypothetical protein